jgi:hypothetical protein
MSLYLCIFDDDEELNGIDVGAYSDFGYFRKTVSDILENQKVGSCFPVLMLHSDCDGEWSVYDCQKLEIELETISAELKKYPPQEFIVEWKRRAARQFSLQPASLYDCFFDVDGEPLLERMLDLTRLAQRKGQPILFQ